VWVAALRKCDRELWLIPIYEVVVAIWRGGRALTNYDSDQWRMRAREMRTFAEQIHDEHCRTMALRIAEDYDRLARQAENDADNP
jgi:hypothetical protein